MDTTSGALARDRFWSVTSTPAAVAHESWGGRLTEWPAQARFTKHAMQSPADLLEVFCSDRDRFDQLLACAGLVMFAPTIRRVISRAELSELNSLLGLAQMAQVVTLKPDLALPGELSPTSVAPLLTHGMDAARHAGISLLAACTKSLDNAWSHHLKIRVARSETFLIDEASALNDAELAIRLEWFAHRLPAFVTAYTHASSTD